MPVAEEPGSVGCRPQTWVGRLQNLSVHFPGPLVDLLPALQVAGSSLVSLSPTDGEGRVDVGPRDLPRLPNLSSHTLNWSLMRTDVAMMAFEKDDAADKRLRICRYNFSSSALVLCLMGLLYLLLVLERACGLDQRGKITSTGGSCQELTRGVQQDVAFYRRRHVYRVVSTFLGFGEMQHAKDLKKASSNTAWKQTCRMGWSIYPQKLTYELET
ncbi:uncharacterized protein AKAME5_001821900 [Lates japonicus]|uniref:Uncharacterized protein n=1 Tax=Lates japonicus TaxID=270547 RepID=A0AAD3N8A0_LATJO|nr:uncharacterized protein AKAME5_001821900 [Lates japonicus]